MGEAEASTKESAREVKVLELAVLLSCRWNIVDGERDGEAVDSEMRRRLECL